MTMLDNIKNFIARFTRRTLIIAASVILGILVLAIVVSIVLNGAGSAYSTLFSKVSGEDASNIIRLLGENNIGYKYEDDGDILVSKNNHDRAMAIVAASGYPNTGFAYEISGRANSMSTDSVQKRYELYDLQDRIAATIRMFDGVQDAKVTIALSEENRYVLSEDEDIPATASVFVKMVGGGAPKPGQVAAIQRFLATSIRGVAMENVAVIDGNGNDVSVVLDDDTKNSQRSPEDLTNAAMIKSDMEKMVERHVADNVLSVFNSIYGTGNVRVAAKAKVNMQSVMRESITYSVPEKINDQDKKGLIARESASGGSADVDGGAQGVVGTETNAEIPEYNTAENENNGNLRDYQFAREYLYNQIKEQGSIPAGAIEDLSLSISVNGADFGTVSQDSLVNLAGNAAGIAVNERRDKITIVSAKYAKTEQVAVSDVTAESFLEKIPSFLWAVIGAVLMILIFLLVLFLLRRRRMLMELQMAAIAAEQAHESGNGILPAIVDSNSEYDEEKIMLQNDRGMGLRKDVREFADKNPEIAARLLKTWLGGGEEDA